MQPERVLVSGASGYVGGRIAAAFRARGAEVIGMVRSATKSGHPAIEHRLGEPVDPGRFETLPEIPVFVHCAWDFGVHDPAEMHRVNVDGSLALFRYLHGRGTSRLVLISTMSAFPGCRSRYGQAKLELESEVLRLGGAVVRPGLVTGADAGGMVGALAKLVNIAPVLPAPWPGDQKLYLCDEERLAQLVWELAVAEALPTAPIIAASEDGLSFADILREIAASRGRRLWLIPVWWRLPWAGLKLIEAAGIRPRSGSDSLLSLMNQDPSPDFGPTRALGSTFPRPEL